MSNHYTTPAPARNRRDAKIPDFHHISTFNRQILKRVLIAGYCNGALDVEFVVEQFQKYDLGAV